MAGKGSSLSFQELPDFNIVTTSAPVLQQAEPGNHYASGRTLLDGKASDHNDRQAPLYLDHCGFSF